MAPEQPQQQSLATLPPPTNRPRSRQQLRAELRTFAWQRTQQQEVRRCIDTRQALRSRRSRRNAWRDLIRALWQGAGGQVAST